ncbi:MAG: endonuclease/exonuclease/phosphatase family protein [Promethearchaeota archaeon]
MVLARILEPLFDTKLRMLISGLGVGCFMFYFPAFLSRKQAHEGEKSGFTLGIGLSIALTASILFRTLNSSIDISTYSWFQVIGWILGGIEIMMMLGWYYTTKITPPADSNSNSTSGEPPKSKGRILGLTVGIFSIFLLIIFVFNGTTVLARWTEGNYILITISIMALLGLFIMILIFKPELIFNLKPSIIWGWNSVFVLSLVATIAVNQVVFPATLDIYPIVVAQPTIWKLLPLGFLILLLPILFIDFILLIRQLIHYNPSNQKLALSFTFGGGLYTLIMVFAIIFTSTWGFVPPVSFFFRDGFWFVFAFIGIFLIILNWNKLVKPNVFTLENLQMGSKTKNTAAVLVGIICIGAFAGVIAIEATPIDPPVGATQLKVLTYNLQQGVNDVASKNYDGQLELIRAIDADIIGLQEASKIAGNSDVVRYFANKLNMYSYFGESGVTGTTGVALLSKYPIVSAVTLYHYNEDSDRKQTATIEAEILIGSQTFTFYITHTFGSMDAKSMLVSDVLARAVEKENPLFIGDFNFRQNSEAYNLTTDVLVDAWLHEWPTAVDDNGLNASRRIDHIFVHPDLTILSCEYIDWDSEIRESDHPACAAVIQL